MKLNKSDLQIFSVIGRNSTSNSQNFASPNKTSKNQISTSKSTAKQELTITKLLQICS